MAFILATTLLSAFEPTQPPYEFVILFAGMNILLWPRRQVAKIQVLSPKDSNSRQTDRQLILTPSQQPNPLGMLFCISLVNL